MRTTLFAVMLLGMLCWCGAAWGVSLQYKYPPAMENVYAATLLQSSNTPGSEVKTTVSIVQGASVKKGITTLISRQEAVTGKEKQLLVMLTDITPQGHMSNVRMQQMTSKGLSKPAAPIGMKPESEMLSPYGETLLFPKRELNLGDSWTETGAMQMQDIVSTAILSGTYSITYTLKSKDTIDGKSCYVILGNYTITCPKQPGRTTPAVSLTSVGTATFYFDPQLGDVRQVKTSAHITYGRYLLLDSEARNMQIDATYSIRLVKSRKK